MFNFDHIDSRDAVQFYKEFKTYVAALIEGERDLIANLANVSALIYNMYHEINWAGFYLNREDVLVLGPFQGLPACIRIPLSKGVCGTAAMTKTTQVVEDVHTYPGHIPCDGNTNSEIVVPMIKENRLIGVLDIDSPVLKRFTEVDQLHLEAIVALILEGSDC